jgi:acylphosphatase
MACARFIIHGRVQGVFFRAATRREALRLGIAGHAKNCADGSVEVVAAGAREALDKLADWLQHGPPAARVDHVDREAMPAQNLKDFLTR